MSSQTSKKSMKAGGWAVVMGKVVSSRRITFNWMRKMTAAFPFERNLLNFLLALSNQQRTKIRRHCFLFTQILKPSYSSCSIFFVPRRSLGCAPISMIRSRVHTSCVPHHCPSFHPICPHLIPTFASAMISMPDALRVCYSLDFASIFVKWSLRSINHFKKTVFCFCLHSTDLRACSLDCLH